MHRAVAMRLAPAVLVLMLAAPVFASLRTWESPAGTSARGQRSGNAKGASNARLTQQPPRSAALIEGSDETIEPYSKNQPGRHVCTQEQAVTEPVRTRESYCRPVYKTYTLPCEQGKTCRRYRVVYETAFRDVLKMRVSRKTSYSCCPGWAQGGKANHGCTKAVCTQPCNNGGACLKPEFCGCRPGFTGKHCEQDVDECVSERHSCDHTCINTDGSYYCTCRHGFTLNSDGRSCHGDTSAPTTQVPHVSSREDREELEDDDERDFSVEYVNLTRRISKLEKLMSKPHHPEEKDSFSLNEISSKLQNVIDSVTLLKNRVDRMERRLIDHHHHKRRSHLITEDPKVEALSRQMSVLERRMDKCACASESRNKINL